MRPVAIDEFRNFQYLSALEFAPGGRNAAFVVSACEKDLRGYRGEIWLYCGETGALVPLTAAGKEKRFCWEDAGSLIFPAQRTDAEKKSAEAGPYTAFYRIRTDGGEARFAFDLPLREASLTRAAQGFVVRSVYDPADYRPKEEGVPQADVQVLEELPYWVNGRGFVSRKRSRLHHYNVETGTLTPLTPELADAGAMALSPDGKRLAYGLTAFDSVRPQKTSLKIVDLASGETQDLLPQEQYRINSLEFLYEDVLIAAMTDGSRYETSENGRLYRLDLPSGAMNMVAAPDRDLGGNASSDCRLGGGSTFQAWEGHLYFTLGVDNSATLYQMDAQGTLKACSDGQGSIDCFALGEGKTLFIGMRDGGLQELYSLEQGQVRCLSQFNIKALEDCSVAQPKPLSFINGDGVRIDGWVLTPPDFDPKNQYPAVFNIHGGPKAIFGDVFHHEMQFWASRGYVVFFCNPRGSGGRGDEFADLRGKYGTIDYDDLMAFADQVLDAYPAIDPARVCVAGGSYGGFMVNWIIGHTTRFAAAASQRSIANWTSKCLTTDIGYYHNLSQIAGDPWNTPELFWEKSPLKHAPAAKTPTLFIHSDQDYRCWMSEGLQMFSALKMHGIPTRLCLFAGENHELSRSGKPVNRIRRLQEITDWFDQYVG